MVGDQLRGPRLLVAEFGMLMDIATPDDELLLDGGGPLADLSFKRRALRAYARRKRGERREQRYAQVKSVRRLHGCNLLRFPGLRRTPSGAQENFLMAA